MRIFYTTIIAFPGNATFRAGKWMINCMPLIMPQIWERLPDITVCRIALPTTAAVEAAVAP